MFKKLLFVLGAIVASALLTEGLLRVLAGDDTVIYPRFHSRAEYGRFVLRRLLPQSEFWHTSADGTWQFITNRQGFRDTRDYSYDKPPGELRVLVLGGADAQGLEVRQSQTFAEVIERYLGARGVPALVLNSGVAGFGTAEELAFLEAEGFRYRPDVVVVGISAGDEARSAAAGLYALQDGALSEAKTEYAPGVRILDVWNEVSILRWASQHTHAVGRLLEWAVPAGAEGAIQEGLEPALLERMHRLTKEEGVKLILIDLPMPDPREGFLSSLSEETAAIAQKHSDALLSSDEVLGPYRHLIEVHLPHGRRHLSEFAHTVVGAAAGAAILRLTESGTTAPTARTSTLTGGS